MFLVQFFASIGLMDKKLILDHKLIEIIISRLCHQVIENHKGFKDSVIIGLQPRGVWVADKIHKKINDLIDGEVPLGYLDVTFYRDDFRRRDTPIKANETKISFIIENKNVLLVDDVLYTGRTVRAALDAMTAFGRPRKVELLVLINRRYSRDLPIEPDYTGQNVNTIRSQRIEVAWQAQGHKQNQVWLVNHNPE